MTTTSDPRSIDPALIAGLDTATRGPVVLPGASDYDDARSVWNAMIDRHPAAILRCLGAGDVVAGVNFARENGLDLSIKGGGHNIAGLAVSDGALTLDMSLMRGVWLDQAAGIARAQAGCVLGDIDRETQLHGQAAVLGFVSETGAAGLTLGGGFGYLSRKYGWTSDNVQGMDVVTADGRIVRASDDENSDLFWALRGGGGNFGVVTGFDYDVYPLGPQVMAGAMAWSFADAAEVLDVYREVTAAAAPELTCVAVIRKAPPAPWIDPEFHGKHIVAIFVCDSGSLDSAEKRVAPLKSFGSPVGDALQPKPYTAQQQMLDAAQPKGRRYYWKSEYLPALSPDLLSGFIDHGGMIESPHSAIILFALGGAVGDQTADHSAVGNRDAEFVLNITSSWEDEADDEHNIGWARDAWSGLRQFSTGGTYINFLTEEETGDRIEAAFGDNFQRLADVKTAWDPDNVFRVNKNIAPRR